jgi:hypothetical protein
MSNLESVLGRCPTDKAHLRELSGASRGGPQFRHPQCDAFADCNSLCQQISDKIIGELEHSRVPLVQPWGQMSKRRLVCRRTPPPGAPTA